MKILIHSGSTVWSLTRDAQKIVVRDEEQFQESKHPRASNGQFGSGGGGSAGSSGETSKMAESVQHNKQAHTHINGKVKGSSPERVAMRKLLKSPHIDKELKGKLNAKILESFETQHAALQKKGGAAGMVKAAELETKMMKMGWKKPAPKTTAEANEGYSQKVQSDAKSVMQAVLPAPAQGTTYSPEQTATFNDLASISSVNTAKAYCMAATAKVNQGKAPGLSVGECAHVVAYTGSAYKDTNSQLRAGVMDEQTWKHASHLNKALSKLPPHRGQVYRKATLDTKDADLYKSGFIVEERGFTSTAKSSGVWNGNVHFIIESKTGRDISKISSHPGEQEVLFRSGTRFRITKAEKTQGGRKIYMEEVDG